MPPFAPLLHRREVGADQRVGLGHDAGVVAARAVDHVDHALAHRLGLIEGRDRLRAADELDLHHALPGGVHLVDELQEALGVGHGGGLHRERAQRSPAQTRAEPARRDRRGQHPSAKFLARTFLRLPWFSFASRVASSMCTGAPAQRPWRGHHPDRHRPDPPKARDLCYDRGSRSSESASVRRATMGPEFPTSGSSPIRTS